MSASKNWTMTMLELPGVMEDGMPGRNGQRKPGTARGSPRRSRTAKASRISRHAAKSGRAREWGGWGRLSDDGPGQHNPDPSEDPWGGGLPHLHGGALTRNRPDTARAYRVCQAMHEGWTQTEREAAYAGSRLKPTSASGRPRLKKPAFQPYRGKPAVRNDRGDRGNVGIIRSPVRASILPDCGGRSAMSVSTAITAIPNKIWLFSR
jgi:hypothetical protein